MLLFFLACLNLLFTYVMVTEPLTGAHAGVIRAPYAVYDTRFATGYYRPLPDGRLLWGGRISTRERQRDLHQLMRRDLARVYPSFPKLFVRPLQAERCWAAAGPQTSKDMGGAQFED